MLRRLIAKYASGRTVSVLGRVRAMLREKPGRSITLITDLFEKITLYDMKARDATAKKALTAWDVPFAIDGKKAYADGLGRQTDAPMSEISRSASSPRSRARRASQRACCGWTSGRRHRNDPNTYTVGRSRSGSASLQQADHQPDDNLTMWRRRGDRMGFLTRRSLLNLSVPWWELVVRALVVFLFLLLILRLTGKRQWAARPVDLVLLLVLNAVQNAINGGDNSLAGGLIRRNPHRAEHAIGEATFTAGGSRNSSRASRRS